MTSSPYLAANSVGIGELISTRKRLHVPSHQRDFAWGEDEVREFLEDITRACKRNAAEYFLGLVVLVGPNEGVWKILDGQQRLATTTMLFAAMRQWLAARDKVVDSEQIEGEYIAVRRLGATRESRLVMNAANNEEFERSVVVDIPEEELKRRLQSTDRGSTNWLLLRAALLCRQFLAGWLSELGSQQAEQVARLYALSAYIESSVKVVCLEVASAVDAYVVFESLNFRGHDLSALDLVKNYLFGEAFDAEEKLSHDWAVMQQHISTADADDFLRMVWTSRFGRVQRGDLFQQIKVHYQGRSGALAFSEILKKAAPIYDALSNSASDLWWRIGPKCASVIEALEVFKARQVRPIALASLDRWGNHELMPKLLWNLLVLTFRYQTVGKRRTGALEIGCARVAQSISSGESEGLPEIVKALRAISPSDEEFEADVMKYSETRPERAKLVLALSQYADHPKNISDRLAILQRSLAASGTGPDSRLVPRHTEAEVAGLPVVDSEHVEQLHRSLGKLGNLKLVLSQDFADTGLASSSVDSASPLGLTADFVTDFIIADIDEHQRHTLAALKALFVFEV